MNIALMNDFQIRIDEPIHWLVIVIAVIGLVISLLLVYRRFYRRKSDVAEITLEINNKPLNDNKLNTLRLSLVILANVFACFSLVLFVLPIELKIKNTEFDVLLTTGINYSVNANEFTHVKLHNKPLHEELTAARYIWLMAADNQEGYSDEFISHLTRRYKNKVLVIKSTQELSRLWQQQNTAEKGRVLSHSYPPKMLKIVGDGLNEKQWQQLDFSNINGVELAFLPSKKLLGVIELNWPKELYLGQTMKLVGKLQKPRTDKENYQLSLFYNKQLVDSTSAAENGSFSLKTNTKISGLFNYQLVLNRQNKDSSTANTVDSTTEKASGVTSNEALLNNAELIENIAVSVLGSSKPRVIIKQSAPSFETRQLKQWLVQANSPVKVITKISKNKWSQQRINLDGSEKDESEKSVSKSSNSHQLTANLLHETDLLILDSRALLNLELTELSALELAVKEGLGLYINIDESLLQTSKLMKDKSMNLLASFAFQALTLEQNQVMPLWPGQNAIDVESPAMTRAVAIDITARHGQVLVASADGRQLVVNQQFGLGNVAISTLTQTYPWALESGEVFYSQYWQTILSKVIRVNSTRWLAAASDKLTLAKQQTEVCLISSSKQIFSSDIKLSNYPLSTYKKCGIQVSNKAGWTKLQALNENQMLLAEQTRYIYPRSAFKAWQQADKQKLSARNSGLNTFSAIKITATAQYQEINKRYLWLILLLSLTFLWLERKGLTG